MKCINCGTVFEEGVFCPECGTKYDEEEIKRKEAEEQELEKKRKELEEMKREKTRRQAEEKRVEKEKLQQEEKEKRELELAKTKAEQERLSAERVAHEAELARLQNERLKIEQENRLRTAELENKKKEELSRTFNGVIYNSIEEKTIAQRQFEENNEILKKQKRIDMKAIWSFILAIAVYPLIMTIVLWFPAYVVSVVLGIMALKERTSKRGFVIASLIIDGLMILIVVIVTIYAIVESGNI